MLTSERRVCGTVNAKNAFGAYTGRKPFAYFVLGRGPDIVLTEQSAMNAAEDRLATSPDARAANVGRRSLRPVYDALREE